MLNYDWGISIPGNVLAALWEKKLLGLMRHNVGEILEGAEGPGSFIPLHAHSVLEHWILYQGWLPTMYAENAESAFVFCVPDVLFELDLSRDSPPTASLRRSSTR
jgi:hypothetical protein